MYIYFIHIMYLIVHKCLYVLDNFQRHFLVLAKLSYRIFINYLYMELIHTHIEVHTLLPTSLASSFSFLIVAI